MITRRDLMVAGVAMLLTVTGIALAETTGGKPVMHSCFFNWNDLKVDTTKTGERRLVFDAPTPALGNFECHITSLNPGQIPHQPHHHPEEELMVVKEGTLQIMQNGVTNIVTAGGIIFEASNEWHGMKNIGTTPATYYVFKIAPHDLGK